MRCLARSGEREDSFPPTEVHTWTRPGCYGPHARPARACLHTHRTPSALQRAALLPWGRSELRSFRTLASSSSRWRSGRFCRPAGPGTANAFEHSPARIEHEPGRARADKSEAAQVACDDVPMLFDPPHLRISKEGSVTSLLPAVNTDFSVVWHKYSGFQENGVARLSERARHENVSSAQALLLHDAAQVAGGSKRPCFFIAPCSPKVRT
jgi:hypothetical protein